MSFERQSLRLINIQFKEEIANRKMILGPYDGHV